MPQRCATCGAENPATNRFCGQCGTKLEFAPCRPGPERDNSANDNTDNAAANSANQAAVGDPVTSAPADSHPLNKYRVVIDHPHTAASGFLGLTSDDVPDDDEHEQSEPASHARRNVALFVVTAALLLTALQWRFIRDYSLRRHSLASAPNASKPAEPPNPTGVTAGNSTGLATGAPAAATQVATSSPSDPARSVQPTGDLPEPAPLAANSNPSVANSPASNPLASNPSNPISDTASPRAMGAPVTAAPVADAPVADLPESQSPAVSNPHANLRELPGSYELNRATHARDAQTRASWLWNAVSKGNAQASVELARMYMLGEGVVQNCDQAQVLLRGAAAKGNAQARLSLHQILYQGGCAPR